MWWCTDYNPAWWGWKVVGVVGVRRGDSGGVGSGDGGGVVIGGEMVVRIRVCVGGGVSVSL